MRISAASCTAVHDLVSGPVQPARWLGASPSALYLITRSSTDATVLAILAHDAVRLPCALVVPQLRAELPLSTIAPGPDRRHAATARVGNGEISWEGDSGRVTIAATRQWAPARVRVGSPLPDPCHAVSARLSGIDIGVPDGTIEALVRAGRHREGGGTAVAALLGRGPGLTPSGDDVLAGFALGCRAFGHQIPGVLAAVSQLAPADTSALSAQLLQHAASGESVPEVVEFIDALTGRADLYRAVERLLAVGHTSGAALALGVLAAALYPTTTYPTTTYPTATYPTTTYPAMTPARERIASGVGG
jgi:hypothetical protein